MDNLRYRKAIQRTMRNDLTEREKLSMLGMGLVGEAGEIVDSLKKVLYHGHEVDREGLIKELGDLEWYLQHLKEHFGISDELVYMTNVMKLRQRYPHGFSESDSINREL